MRQQIRAGILASGLAISVAAATWISSATAAQDEHHQAKSGTQISMSANGARLIRRVMGR